MARPRQVSDEAILAAARIVFLEHGPSASTQAVANAVGLSQPALFKRFGTKAELMLKALLPKRDPEWMILVASGPSLGAGGREQLVELIMRMNAFFTEYAPCFGTLRASGLHHSDVMARFDEPPPRRAHRLISEWLERAATLGLMRPSRFSSVALSLIGSIQGRVMLEHTAQLPVPADFLDTVVDVYWATLSPEELR